MSDVGHGTTLPSPSGAGSGNKRYANGRAFEYRVKKLLEADGWTCWRTPGSKSQADLVCVRGAVDCVCFAGLDSYECGCTPHTELRLVQAKGGKSTLTRAKRTSFKAFAESLGGEAWLASRGLKLERL